MLRLQRPHHTRIQTRAAAAGPCSSAVSGGGGGGFGKTARYACGLERAVIDADALGNTRGRGRQGAAAVSAAAPLPTTQPPGTPQPPTEHWWSWRRAFHRVLSAWVRSDKQCRRSQAERRPVVSGTVAWREGSLQVVLVPPCLEFTKKRHTTHYVQMPVLLPTACLVPVHVAPPRCGANNVARNVMCW
jgi:hypothetical protein